MIYGDTSFLFAVYNSKDVFHEKARNLNFRLQEPNALTLLGELELLTNVHRGLAAKVINRQQHDGILRQILEDEADGILVRQSINETDLYRRAREFAKKYIPEISLRSADILHVAAAQILRTSHFISFDDRQRLLAQETGLSVLPRTLPAA